MSYTYIKKSSFSFEETLDELRLAFEKEWYWVVSNVNIAEKIQRKIDKTFPKYVTLWFCKPDLAYKYLNEDINLWIFMPCSISIYEKDNKIFISAWLPENVIDKVIKNKNLKKISFEISELMKKVIDSI